MKAAAKGCCIFCGLPFAMVTTNVVYCCHCHLDLSNIHQGAVVVSIESHPKAGLMSTKTVVEIPNFRKNLTYLRALPMPP